jgi:outer-membrane receptor for ferric coprogen and ferric-rhodotorulic acid
VRKHSARRAQVCTFLCSLPWLFSDGRAAVTVEPHQFEIHIPSQPLADALQELAHQGDVQIIFFSSLTADLNAPALDGRYSISDALERLLADSKLTFRQINPNTLQITRREDSQPDAPTAPPSSKAARTRKAVYPGSPTPEESRNLDEVTVVGTSEGLVATRTETPLRKIPQTLSIVSAEQMRQQNDVDVTDVLNHSPGITLVRNSSLDTSYFSRGYQITTYHIDGGASLNTMSLLPIPYLNTPDLSEFDHIEILRGADGLFGGNGNPGATISLIRKRPLTEPQLRVNASGGSWGNYRVETDLTGPLLGDGSLRGRIDAAYMDRGYFFDRARLQRKKVFGVLEYDLDSSASLVLGGSYERLDALPLVGGVPINLNGTDSHLPRSTGLTFDWASYRTRISEVYLQAWKYFGSDWKLRLNATGWNAHAQYALGSSDSPVNQATGGLQGTPLAYFTEKPDTQTQYGVDLTLTGAFQLFGRQGKVAFGADLTRFRSSLSEVEYAHFEAPVSDVDTYNPATYPDPRLTQTPVIGLDAYPHSRQGGVYGALQLFLTDSVSLITGGRISRDSTVVDYTLRGGLTVFNSSLSASNSHIGAPYAAVLYDLDTQYTMYASYAEVYHSFDVVVRPDGAPVGPARGTDIEAGIKGAWRGNALNGSLVIYRVDQFRIASPVSEPPDPGIPSLSCCFEATANRSSGIDLELSGTPAPGWLLNAGYTYNNNESAHAGRLSYQTPRHLLKLWTSWKLPGTLSAWTVGGDLQAVSANSSDLTYCVASSVSGACTDDKTHRIAQQSRAVFGSRIAWRYDPHWELSFRVNNVFDKRFYDTLGGTATGTWYGDPRNVLLRVDAVF